MKFPVWISRLLNQLGYLQVRVLDVNFCRSVGMAAGSATTRFNEIISPTPWKINMEPENDGLEDDFPFQLGEF